MKGIRDHAVGARPDRAPVFYGSDGQIMVVDEWPDSESFLSFFGHVRGAGWRDDGRCRGHRPGPSRSSGASSRQTTRTAGTGSPSATTIAAGPEHRGPAEHFRRVATEVVTFRITNPRVASIARGGGKATPPLGGGCGVAPSGSAASHERQPPSTIADGMDQGRIRNFSIIAPHRPWQVDARRSHPRVDRGRLCARHARAQVLDSMELEARSAAITIKAQAVRVPWKGHELNLIDTPRPRRLHL